MRLQTRVLLIATAVAAVAGIAFVVQTMRSGFSALDEPTAVEAAMASMMRRMSAPSDLKKVTNPLPLDAETMAEARAHWADHCATCHGNDGKGSDLGKKMYPRAPDMTARETQEQSDGELFATIENGVRLTGMPAFGAGTADSARASWSLVHFIRHLPKLTSGELAQMARLNPKSPAEYEEMKAEEAFLAGAEPAAGAAANTHQH